MRRLAAVLGALLGLAVVPLALLAMTTPVSLVGWVYVLGALGLVAGLVSAPFRSTRRRGVIRASVGLLVAVIFSRIATAGHGKTVSMTRGESASAPWLDRLLPEDDVAVTSARAVVFLGMLPAADTKTLVPTLKRAFASMDRGETSTPSPIVMTALGAQGAGAFDTIEVAAPDPGVHAAVLFLHGYGGNFTLQCWSIAQAARRAGAATFCPSTRLAGDWWRGPGPEIARESMRRIRARGFDRIVLAGLSNGGIGASVLASQLRPGLVGLLLVSGATPDAPAPDLPTLVLEGSHDTMMSPRGVRSYATRVGATYVELEGTHFVLIEQPEAATDVMARWLSARFGS